jgi:hypothetical protein
MLSQEHAPARSVALITAEMPEAFPPAGGRALEVAPMEVVSMVAVVDDIVDQLYSQVKRKREFKNGKEYHVAEDFDFCST